MIRRYAVPVLTLLALLLAIPASQATRPQLTAEQQAYQRPLTDMLDRTYPGSEIHVLSTRPLRLVGTINAGPARLAELESSLRSLLNPDQCLLLPGRAPWRPRPELLWAGVALLAAFPVLQALRGLLSKVKSKLRPPGRRWRQACCFSPAVLLAGVVCLAWPLWTVLPGLVALLACLPRRSKVSLSPLPPRERLREASLILMSYPPDFSAQCMRLLKLEHMQALSKIAGKLRTSSQGERATLMTHFSIEIHRIRKQLGVCQSTEPPDPALVARVLEERYLDVARPAGKIRTFRAARAGSRSRRRIYSCTLCDEVFIDEESLRRHEATHAPGQVARRPISWRHKSAAALLALAALTTVFHGSFRTSARVTFPGAQPLTGTEEQAIAQVEQLFPRANLLLIQGRDSLVLAAPTPVQARLQPLLSLNSARFHTIPVPSRPTWKWWVAAQLASGLLLLVRRPERAKPAIPAVESPPVQPPVPATPAPVPGLLEDVSFEFGTSLVHLVDLAQSSKLNARCASLRQHLAQELGLPLNLFRFHDNSGLDREEYLIRLRGVEMGRGRLRLDQFLAIGPLEKLARLPGEIIEDPSYGLPGKWVDPERRRDCERLGCMIFDPVSVLATHLTDLLRQQAGRLLAYDQVCSLLDHDRYHALVQALHQRGIDGLVIWRVLRLLLDELVSIRDLLTILEALAEHSHLTQDPEFLTEFARQGLAAQISAACANDSKCIHVICMEPALTDMLDHPLSFDDNMLWMDALGTQIKIMADRGLKTVILCPPDHRAEVRRRLCGSYPYTAFLSWNEIAPGYTINSVGTATM